MKRISFRYAHKKPNKAIEMRKKAKLKKFVLT